MLNFQQIRFCWKYRNLIIFSLCRQTFEKTAWPPREPSCWVSHHSVTAAFKGSERRPRSDIEFHCDFDSCTYFQPDLVGISWSYFNANNPYFSFLTRWSLLENKSLQWQAHLQSVSDIFPVALVFGGKPAWMAPGDNRRLTPLRGHSFLEIYSGAHSSDFLLSGWLCH